MILSLPFSYFVVVLLLFFQMSDKAPRTLKASPFAKKPEAVPSPAVNKNHGEVKVWHITPQYDGTIGLQGIAVRASGMAEKNITDPIYNRAQNVSWLKKLDKVGGIKWVFKVDDGSQYGQKWLIFLVQEPRETFLTQDEVKNFVETDVFPLIRSKFRPKNDNEKVRFADDWYTVGTVWNDLFDQDDDTQLVHDLAYHGVRGLDGSQDVGQVLTKHKLSLYSMWEPGHIPRDAFIKYNLTEANVDEEDWKRYLDFGKDKRKSGTDENTTTPKKFASNP